MLGVRLGGYEEWDQGSFLGFAFFVLLPLLLDHQDPKESSSPIFAQQDLEILGFAGLQIHPIPIGEKSPLPVPVGIASHEVVDGVFIDMIPRSPVRQKVLIVPVSFQNRSALHRHPEEVVGFADKTVLARDRGGKSTLVVNDPIVGLHFVRHLEDLGCFRCIAGGDEDLGGAEFLGNAEISSKGRFIDAASG